MGICASSSTSKKSRVEGTNNNCQDIIQENERIAQNRQAYIEAPGASLAGAICDQNRPERTRFRSDSESSNAPSQSTASSSFSLQICSNDKSRSHMKETQESKVTQNNESNRKYSHIGELPANLKPLSGQSCGEQPQTTNPSGMRLSRLPQLAERSQVAAGRPGLSTGQSGFKVFLQSDSHGITTRVPELAQSIDDSSLMKKRTSVLRKNCFFEEGESNKLPPPASFFKKKIM